MKKAYVKPDYELKAILRRRYEIYKGLYPALKDSFVEFHEVKCKAEQCDTEQHQLDKKMKRKKYRGNSRKKRK